MMGMRMEQISRDELEIAMKGAPERINKKREITEKEFTDLLKDMQNPVNAQKEIAVRIKLFLDKRIGDELDRNGVLGDNTRKWIETYTSILDKLQRALHGDKTLNLHVHQITHGEIAAKMRESVIDVKEVK